MSNINQLVMEALVISDKPISIDLHKFESGEVDKLLLLGLSGSGKSTIAKQIASNYNAKVKDLDDCYWAVQHIDDKQKRKQEKIKCIQEILKNGKRSVVEGTSILDLPFKIIKKYPYEI